MKKQQFIPSMHMHELPKSIPQKFQRHRQRRAAPQTLHPHFLKTNGQKKSIAFPDISPSSLWCYINQEYQHLRDSAMNISCLNDAFLLNCPSYAYYVMSDHSVLYNSSFPLYFPRSFPTESQNCEHLTMDCLQEFHSKSENNIVLSTEDSDRNKKTFSLETDSKSSDSLYKGNYTRKNKKRQDKTNKNGKKGPQGTGKESRQKENRNIFSNILRIFMKNVLQQQIYANLINRIISKHHFSFSATQFYDWLYSFNINFKNYIRFKQLLKILTLEGEAVKDYQRVLILLLQDYLSDYCTQHSLTSRKINGKGRKMHIEGIRLLQQSLTKLRASC